jgi:hypothetical protein
MQARLSISVLLQSLHNAAWINRFQTESRGVDGLAMLNGVRPATWGGSCRKDQYEPENYSNEQGTHFQTFVP